MMFVFVWLIGAVFAKEIDPELAAECKRIREEMMTLAQQEAWSGVERHYQQILAIERSGGLINGNDHMLAASASASRGDLDELVVRLTSAVDAGSAEKAQVWLETLMTQTAIIEIKLQVAGAVAIKPSTFIVDQSYSAALRKAEQELLRTGEYIGRLPIGTYTIVSNAYSYPMTVIHGDNPKILVDSSALNPKADSTRFGSLFIGSYNQYLKNSVIEVAPRSHSSFGGMLGYSYTRFKQKLAYGSAFGFAVANGVGATHVLALSNVWVGQTLKSGAIGIGPQIATGWSRVTGITEAHAALLCDPSLCSDFDRLIDETVSQTRYINAGLQLSYQHLPSEGVSWTIYTGSLFERGLMVLNLGVNLSLGRTP